MKLNQVTISVGNIERSEAFYLELGFELIVKTGHYCRFIVPGNNATFSIHLADQPSPGNTVIYFECDELDKTVEALKKKGIHFIQDPVDQSWLWREAILKDPDGHTLCLYHAGENRLNPPWRLQH